MPAAADQPSRRSLAERFLAEQRPAEVDEATLAQLRRFVSDGLGGARVSDRYLLELAERAGVPVSRTLGGLPPDLRDRVHFHDLAAAEASLLDLAGEYERARQAIDRQRQQDCRRAVRRGRQRLEWMLGRPGLAATKRAQKQEILSWFRVWLETPELFRSWIELRKRRL